MPQLYNLFWMTSSFRLQHGKHGSYLNVAAPKTSRPLFTKRKDILPQDLGNSRRREIACYKYRIVLKFDRHLGSAAAEAPDKFQIDCLQEFTRSYRKTSVRLVNRGPLSDWPTPIVLVYASVSELDDYINFFIFSVHYIEPLVFLLHYISIWIFEISYINHSETRGTMFDSLKARVYPGGKLLGLCLNLKLLIYVIVLFEARFSIAKLDTL